MVKLRTLTVNDIDKAVELSSAEKWNQTEADWEFLISTPENICLAAVDEGKIVGTATATVYNNDVAWIGMVLVNKNFRGKGISKLLLLELFEKLKHCCSIKLDATPVGQPVYQKFGFENEYNIFRLTNPAVVLNLDDNECGSPIEKFCRKDILEAAGLDCQVFGADRKYLLEYLYKNNPDNSWMIKRGGKVDGIVMGRKGTRYFQVGPLLTESVACGKALLLKVLKDLEGQAVVIDVPFFNKDFLVWLILLGFTIQRPFYRMYQHKNPYPGIPQNQFLISGPEFG